MGGRLCLDTERVRLRISGWPELKAIIQSRHDRRWLSFHPEFRVLPSLRLLPGEESGEFTRLAPEGLAAQAAERLRMAAEQRRALLHFRHAFPTDIARVVGRLPEHQWTILRLLVLDRSTLDLLALNPSLVFALALRFTGPGTHRAVPRLGHEPQRALARHVGFPGTEAAVRILRKVPPEALTATTLERLRSGLINPDALTAMSHLQTIPAGVIALAAEEDLFTRCTASFLMEVAQDPDSVADSAAARMLRETLDMHAALDPGADLRVQGPEQLSRRHERLTAEYRRLLEQRAKAGTFQPSPLPGIDGVIEPLSSVDSLAREGRTQSNCVLGYADAVRQGRLYCYRVLQPERATLSLIATAGGRWTLGELRTACNRPVRDTTRALVEEWLLECGLP